MYLIHHLFNMSPFEKSFSLPSFQAFKHYFSYEVGLHLYDSVVCNMVLERYRASADESDEDYDCDSEEEISVSEEEELNLLDEATSVLDSGFIVFGSFHSNLVPIKPIKPIKPKIKGSTIKIGEITCIKNGFSDTHEEEQALEPPQPPQSPPKHQESPPVSPTKPQTPLVLNISGLVSTTIDQQQTSMETTVCSAVQGKLQCIRTSIVRPEKSTKQEQRYRSLKLCQRLSNSVTTFHRYLDGVISQLQIASKLCFILCDVFSDPLINESFGKILAPSITNGSEFSASRFRVDFTFPALDLGKPLPAIVVPSPEKMIEHTISAMYPQHSTFVFDPGGTAVISCLPPCDFSFSMVLEVSHPPFCTVVHGSNSSLMWRPWYKGNSGLDYGMMEGNCIDS